MFFILSKVLNFLTQPLFYICLALLLSFIFKKEKLKRKLRIAGVVMLFFFSNSFIVDEVYRWWEIPAISMDHLEYYDCAIVLGGMTNRYDAKNDRVSFHGGIDRLLQSLLLQKSFKVDKLLLSSGSGYLMYPEEKEAKMIEKFLNQLDYDLTDFWVESESRNTHENAELSIDLLKNKYGERFNEKRYLIITSGYHMRRAMACFEKQGLKVNVYTTNMKSGPRKFNLEHLLIPSVGAVGRWNALGHELVGYLSYKVMGYI
jgi:uncharacterized SAM-binding protein YcdF (DUF218 family)